MSVKVFKCPLCEAVKTQDYRVCVCEECHVFMAQVIDDGAFEKIDPVDPPKRRKKSGS